MKRILYLVLFVCVASSTAMSQNRNPADVPRTPTERELPPRPGEGPRDPNDHHDWPTRPQITPLAKPSYTSLEAKFAVTNDTVKKVKEITWECTLLHPDTNTEFAKYTLVSKKKIAAHGGAILKKRVNVSLKALYGPVVAANQPNKDVPEVSQALQVNKIIEIKYTDGSVSRP